MEAFPRLPERAIVDNAGDSSGSRYIQAELNFAGTSPSTPTFPDELPLFDEPIRLSAGVAGWGWIGASVLSAVWALVLGIAALRVRGSHAGSESAVDDVDRIGLVGVLAAFLVIVAGAWWSDIRARNIRRLNGRLPSRNRAIRTWLYPGLWALCMTVTLLRVSPHPDFDIRPLIVVLGYIASVGRTHSMLRRIFRSLTRIGEDVLIAGYAVVQGAGFGMIWWRLANWPNSVTEIDAGQAEVLIGVSFASALAFSVSSGLSFLIHRSADRSEEYRTRVLSSRHDQLLLRSMGLDPLDATVRMALARFRQVQERAFAAASTAEPSDQTIGAGDRSIQPTEIAELTAELSADAAEGGPAVGRIRTALGPSNDKELAEVLFRQLIERERSAVPRKISPSEKAPSPDTAEPGVSRLVDLVGRLERRLGGSEPDSTYAIGLAGSQRDINADQRDRLQSLSARFEESNQAAEPMTLGDRIGRREIHDPPATGGQSEFSNPADRFGLVELRRLQAAANRLDQPQQAAHVGGLVTDAVLSAKVPASQVRLIPPRLIPLEVARFLVVLGNAALVAGFGWVVMRTVDLTVAPTAGLLDQFDVDRIDTARVGAVTAVSAIIPLTALWAWAMSVIAHRAQAPTTHPRVCCALFFATLVITGGARVIDPFASGQVSISALATTSILASAALQIALPAASWLGRGSAAMQLWAASGPFIVALVFASGLHHRTESDVSLEQLAFFGVIGGLIAAIVGVVTWLVMLDVGDRLRASSALAKRIEIG